MAVFDNIMVSCYPRLLDLGVYFFLGLVLILLCLFIFLL